MKKSENSLGVKSLREPLSTFEGLGYVRDSLGRWESFEKTFNLGN